MNLDWIASTLGARRARRRERIQSLWGGHGELFRIELDGGPVRTAVVKWARLPDHDDVSTVRKRRSFAVEAAFYRTVAARCDHTCRVAKLLAAGEADDEWILVLEDLDAAGFDQRVEEANGAALDAALAWLASFHARFLDERFDSLWPIGTYWQLETRRDELAAIEDAELRAAAPMLAERLTSARYQTLVHGDPKEANFCFTRTWSEVAAVDFQYTGRGCGIVDVAYLLYGRRDEPVDMYFDHLRPLLAHRDDVAAIEAEWRALYPIARADFRRFLAGWRFRG